MTDFFEWECQKQVEIEEELARMEEEKQRQRDIRRGVKPKSRKTVAKLEGARASFCRSRTVAISKIEVIIREWIGTTSNANWESHV